MLLIKVLGMALDLGMISTGVDAFIKLVREEQRIDINEAALRMGLSRQVLEEWATVLEEQGLIKIEYQLTKVYLVWVARTKEEMEVKASEISDRRAAAVRVGESQLEEIMELSKQLDSLQDEFSKISEAFEVKMGGVKKQLEKMHELKREKEEVNFRISELSKGFESRIVALRAQIDDEAKIAEGSEAEDKGLEAALTAMGPELEQLRVLRKELDAYVAEVGKKSKDIEQRLDAREKEHEELKARATGLEKRLKDSETDVKKVRAEFEKKIGGFVGAGKKSDSDVKGASAELDKRIADAEAVVKDFDARLEKLRRTDAELKRMREEKKEISEQLEKIISGLGLLDFSKGKMTMDEILKRIEDAKSRLAETDKKKEKYEHKQKEMKGSMKNIWKVEGEKKG